MTVIVMLSDRSGQRARLKTLRSFLHGRTRSLLHGKTHLNAHQLTHKRTTSQNASASKLTYMPKRDYIKVGESR